MKSGTMNIMLYLQNHPQPRTPANKDRLAPRIEVFLGSPRPGGGGPELAFLFEEVLLQPPMVY